MDTGDGNNYPPYWQYSIHGRIMLTLVLSLSIAIVIITALHIYSRIVLRRQARLQLSTSDEPWGTTVVQLNPDQQQQLTGVNPSIINMLLPRYKFNKEDHVSLNKENSTMECAVCLSIFKEDEMVRLLPNCSHFFHVDCIDRWLYSQSTCPICRAGVEPRVQPLAREAMVGSEGINGVIMS